MSTVLQIKRIPVRPYYSGYKNVVEYVDGGYADGIMRTKSEVDQKIQRIIDEQPDPFVRVTSPDSQFQRFVNERYYTVPRELCRRLQHMDQELRRLVENLDRSGERQAEIWVRSAKFRIRKALNALIERRGGE